MGGIKSLEPLVGDRRAKDLFSGAKLADLFFLGGSTTSATATSAPRFGSHLSGPFHNQARSKNVAKFRVGGIGLDSGAQLR
jgi:hypothetical protein